MSLFEENATVDKVKSGVYHTQVIYSKHLKRSQMNIQTVYGIRKLKNVTYVSRSLSQRLTVSHVYAPSLTFTFSLALALSLSVYCRGYITWSPMPATISLPLTTQHNGTKSAAAAFVVGVHRFSSLSRVCRRFVCLVCSSRNGYSRILLPAYQRGAYWNAVAALRIVRSIVQRATIKTQHITHHYHHQQQLQQQQ